MKKFKLISFTILSLLLFSCEKEDMLWKLPPSAGTEKVERVSMGENYEKVIFYKLSTGHKEIKNLNDWHIAFNNYSSEMYVRINGGADVQIFNTFDTSFNKKYNVPPFWDWDNPNGKKDSTAVGCWFDTISRKSLMNVYIIDLGKSVMPRYKKIQFMGASPNNYSIRYANLDNFNEVQIDFKRSLSTNFTYCNLLKNDTSNFEPDFHEWDFVFTRYRHVYYDLEPITPYYVTGVLTNPTNTLAAKTRKIKFEDINISNVQQIMLSVNEDVIGFDWKFYDLNAAKYLVDDKTTYIIKDQEGYLYKLKFIDFYDENGVKGAPQFVYSRL
ncbi:MAG: HmuY family protein [Bacteroidota bacterium]